MRFFAQEVAALEPNMLLLCCWMALHTPVRLGHEVHSCLAEIQPRPKHSTCHRSSPLSCRMQDVKALSDIATRWRSSIYGGLRLASLSLQVRQAGRYHGGLWPHACQALGVLAARAGPGLRAYCRPPLAAG